MENYEFIKNIGQGMYGQVFLARNKTENKNYAIKRINFQDIKEKDRQNIENEVLLLKQLRHPNIVSYKDSFIDKDNYYNIVMIYCDGGDIYTKIKNAKNNHFPESDILDWLVQLCLALSYVHDKKILHRDLKTQNMFIQNTNKIRIGDFGIAKIFNQTREMAGSMIGTPLYMSPEQYNGKKYGFKSDIWSLGCCLFEMCNLKHAFEGNSWNAVVVKVIKGQHAPLNSMYSPELKNLVDSMLSLNSKNRPTVAWILERPYMKPKVANYIQDFIQHYKEYDGDEEQVNILKEQAEKFGIFNEKLLKEIDNDYENKTMVKDQEDLRNINENEKKILLEQKRNSEKRIKELEKQKKVLLEEMSIKGQNRKQHFKNGGNVKNIHNINKSISGSKEKNKTKYGSVDKRVPHKKSNYVNNQNINNNYYNDEYGNLKEKNGMNSQSPQIQSRKISNTDENDDKIIKIINNKDNKRPLSSKKVKNEKEDTNNITILYEEQNNYIANRNKITKITQEIGKLKKELERINNKISEFYNNGANIPDESINGGENDEKDNIIDNNKNINNDANKDNKNNNEGNINNNNDNMILTNKEKLINERISFFRNRCINSLGQKLFNKAYEYLKNNIGRNTEPIRVREHLTNIFGKNNIGFWQLIDQILILEKMLNEH